MRADFKMRRRLSTSVTVPGKKPQAPPRVRLSSSKAEFSIPGNAATCNSVVTVLMNSPNEKPGKIKVKVFPNPSKGAVTVSFYLDVAEEVDLEVFDTMGNLVSQRAATGVEGENNITLDILPQDKAGIYFIALRAGKASGRQREWYCKGEDSVHDADVSSA